MVNNPMSNENSDDESKRKKHRSSSDVDELREVAEVLPDLFGALNDSIPKLISNLIGSIYSPESAGNVAKGIGQFYRNLIEEGIPEDVALDMTKKFVSSLNQKELLEYEERSAVMNLRMKTRTSMRSLTEIGKSQVNRINHPDFNGRRNEASCENVVGCTKGSE